MPTECTPDLFGFAPVEGRQVAAALMAAPSARMLAHCFWARRIQPSK